MQFTRKRRVTQFDAVGKVTQLELMAVGGGFLVNPVAVDARFSGFPEVTIAQVSVALHGHHHSIGREFHPNQAHFVRLRDAKNGGF